MGSLRRAALRTSLMVCLVGCALAGVGRGRWQSFSVVMFGCLCSISLPDWGPVVVNRVGGPQRVVLSCQQILICEHICKLQVEESATFGSISCQFWGCSPAGALVPAFAAAASLGQGGAARLAHSSLLPLPQCPSPTGVQPRWRTLPCPRCESSSGSFATIGHGF